MKFFQLLFFFMLLNLLSYGQILRPGCNDYVKIEGRSFMCGGQPFYPITAEYVFYPVHFVQNPTSAADYYLSRTNSYGPCSTSCEFESLTGPLALSEIANDFGVIHQMGFNTIRTAGISPNFEYNLANSPYVCPHPPTSLIQGAQWANNVGIWSGTCMEISTASAPDPYRERLFEFIKEILEKANANSLKVLLDVAYSNITKDDHINDYLNYLALLATKIKTLPLNLQQTLFAYVIVEEPQYEGLLGNTKKEICTKVSDMYDVLHTIDPDHLITIGGADVSDVMEWDPGVMKLDFWCPHIYSDAKKAIELNSDLAVNRVMSQLYWLKNNCPIPWMIGETGFGATDDEVGNGYPPGPYHFPDVDGELGGTSFPPLNGEYYTQKNYAHDMLKMVRDCNGSGYSWWEYQELWWAAPPNPDINGNNYGLLRHGEASDPGKYSILKKPVVDEFENYLDASGQPPAIDPAGGQMPIHYYDPYDNATISPNTNIIHGTILDFDTSNPIKDAYLFGTTILYQDRNVVPFKDHFTGNYTFTNDNGEFTIIPYDYESRFPNDNTILDLKISAVGAERAERGWGIYNPTWLSVLDGETFYLKRNQLGYDGIISNETVSSPNTKNFRGWNSLTTTDVIIQSGASSDFTARTEINVNTEFHAENGSEVHIYPSMTFPDCPDFNQFMRSVANAPLLSANENAHNSEIEISFKKDISVFDVSISPNPNNGRFKIEITNNKNASAEISIFDLMGNVIYSLQMKNSLAEINLSTVSKGMYYISLRNENKVINKKIIIQ